MNDPANSGESQSVVVKAHEETTESTVALLLCDLRDANRMFSKAQFPGIAWSFIGNTFCLLLFSTLFLPTAAAVVLGIGLGIALTLFQHDVGRSKKRSKIIEKLLRAIATTQNEHHRRLEKLESSQPSPLGPPPSASP